MASIFVPDAGHQAPMLEPTGLESALLHDFCIDIAAA
jgi:hypothetical protein